MNIISYIKDVLNELSPKSNILSLSENIKGDIVAGVTVGIIALPLALAFGEISQLGPIAGVWPSGFAALFRVGRSSVYCDARIWVRNLVGSSWKDARP